MKTKICSICKEEKLLDEYSTNYDKLRNKSYYRAVCKKCSNLKTKEWREKNKKRIKEYQKEWLNNNKELMKQISRNYRLNNLEKIKKKELEYRKNNPQKIKETKRKSKEKHKEKIKQYMEKYRKENAKKIKKQANKYYKEKLENDNLFRLKLNMRNLIRYAFESKGYTKETKTEQILGCDFKTFYNHLLETYKNNYGYEWDGIEKVHIDHIKPLKNCHTYDEIYKANYWENLQLLKAKDNLKKGAKLDWGLN